MKKIPSLVININDKCNFRCIYCPPYGENLCKGTDHSDMLSLYKVIDIMVDSGSNLLRLTGGEPLLDIDKTTDLLRYSKGRFKRTVLNTNGFYLKQYLSLLEEFKSFLTLKVSLDSLDEEEASTISGVRGLNETLSSIQEAKKCGWMIELNTVLTGQSIESINRIINYCRVNCFDLKLLTRSTFYGNVPSGDYQKCVISLIDDIEKKHKRLSDERLASGLGLSMLCYANGEKKIYFVDHSLKNPITPNKLFFDECITTCSSFPCDCGVLSITVSTDGILSPCRGRKDLGDNIYGKNEIEITKIVKKALTYFEKCKSINVNELNRRN